MVGVAVKAIIYNANDEILIIKKSKEDDINPETYDIPGGRVEEKESLANALTREIEEETGLKTKIVGPSRVWDFKKEKLHLVGVTFLVKTKEFKVKLNIEHNEFLWVKDSFLLKSKIFPEWIKKEVLAAKKMKNIQ